MVNSFILILPQWHQTQAQHSHYMHCFWICVDGVRVVERVRILCISEREAHFSIYLDTILFPSDPGRFRVWKWCFKGGMTSFILLAHIHIFVYSSFHNQKISLSSKDTSMHETHKITVSRPKEGPFRKTLLSIRLGKVLFFEVIVHEKNITVFWRS